MARQLLLRHLIREGVVVAGHAAHAHLAAHHIRLAFYQPLLPAREELLPAAVIQRERHQELEPAVLRLRGADRPDLRPGQRQRIVEQVPERVRPVLVRRVRHIEHIDHRDPGRMVFKRCLQHPARHAQRLGVVAHVVAGEAVVAPQLHWRYAIEHAAGAQEQHVKVLLFRKERAILALGIVTAHAAIQQGQAANQRRQPERGHRNFFLHLEHPFWGCRPNPFFASRRLTVCLRAHQNWK